MYRLLILAVLAWLTLHGVQAGWPCGQAHECATDCDCPSDRPRCAHRVLAGLSNCVSGPQQPAEPIVFVHIPKTGGTTFRLMAEEVFGFERMCYNYGPDSEHTSPLLLKTFYNKAMRHTFADMARARCSFVGGHVGSREHMTRLGLRQTVSIIRNPEDRLISEYYVQERHIQVHQLEGYVHETFEQFFAHRQQDFELGCMPCHMLVSRHIPPQAFGFIGVTERYEDTLKMFNSAYNLDLKFTGKKNLNELRAKHEEEEPAIVPKVTDAMRARMQPDWKLYRLVSDIFTERKRMFDACKPWVHGSIDEVVDGVNITGWAWWAHSDEPVQVSCTIPGGALQKTFAVDWHPLHKWGAPRHGAVGFTITLPRRLLPDEKARCEVVETGQLLGESTADGKGSLLWKGILPETSQSFDNPASASLDLQ